MRKMLFSATLTLILVFSLFGAFGSPQKPSESTPTHVSAPGAPAEQPEAAAETHNQPEEMDFGASALPYEIDVRGHFVSSASVGPSGLPGFEFFTPLVRTAAFDSDGAYYLMDGPDNVSIALYFDYINGSDTTLEGRLPTEAVVNRFIGSDPEEWTQGEAYERLLVPDVWHGVDVWYTGAAGYPNGLKSAFMLNNSADFNDVKLNVSGAQEIIVSANKSQITIITEVGNVTEDLYCFNWQTEEQIAANYSVDGMVISYEIDPEASWNRMMIDPLIYSTFLGGSSADDRGLGIALNESTGEAYVTGYTASADFPTTAGAFNETISGNKDIYLTKISADGASLVYSTFIGGAGDDGGDAVEIDGAGRAYLVGNTKSTDFPTTVGAFSNTSDAVNGDIVVLRLSADGSDLEWAAVYGGNDWDQARGVALDPTTSDVLLCGFTESADYPNTTGAFQTARSGTSDAFIARITSDGTSLLNSTFIGSTSTEELFNVAVNSTGFVYFGGYTAGTDWPTTFNAYQNVSGGSKDLVCGVMSANLSVLHVSSYVGGVGDDYGGWMAMHDDRVVLVAETSGSWPVTSGAYNESYAGGTHDVGVAVLDMRLDGLLNATYVGGSLNDVPLGVALDQDGNAYVVGWTESTDFPVHSWAFNDSHAGNRDVYVAKLAYDLAELLYCTFVGGSGNDYGQDIAIKTSANAWSRDIYVVGHTDSTDFPTTVGAFEETSNGNFDAFTFVLGGTNPHPHVENVSYSSEIDIYQNWTLFANVTALGTITNVTLHYNGCIYVMNNTNTPEAWNYTVSVRTTITGTNNFTVLAASYGNETETALYYFTIGDLPHFESISAPRERKPGAAWVATANVTDALTGDTGVAGVWISIEGGAWEAVPSVGIVYTSTSRTFEEGSYAWQLKAEDNAGNIVYSSSYRLTVGYGPSEPSAEADDDTVTAAAAEAEEEEPAGSFSENLEAWWGRNWYYFVLFASSVGVAVVLSLKFGKPGMIGGAALAGSILAMWYFVPVWLYSLKYGAEWLYYSIAAPLYDAASFVYDSIVGYWGL